MTLSYTLIADGSSDIAIMSIIDWLIREHRPDLYVVGQFAGNVGQTAPGLAERLSVALRLFPCDILFVHRDAEGASLADRQREIAAAVGTQHPRWVTVVPVRMTEAWLLSDEAAIRAAAGNRRGVADLGLPPKRNWQSLKDPKRILFDALRTATEKSGRTLAKFSATRARLLVGQRTADFSALRGISSFDMFENRLVAVLMDL